MMYLLDTNVCILYLNGRSESVRDRLQGCSPVDIRVCSVVKAELFAGAAKSTWPERTLDRQRLFLDSFISLPFDDAAADVYATVRATLESKGTPIGPYDMMIAAIALVHGLTLATSNVGEFSRIPALPIENWQSAS